MQQERKELLIEVAKKYYIENKSQQQIAVEMHMSRSNISRLLKNCTEKNIVEIKINDNLSKNPALALEIKKHFNLKDVLIAQTQRNIEKSRENVGALTAEYIYRNSFDGMKLGVTWGRTSYYAANHIQSPDTKKIDVVQMVGGISGQTIETDGHEITKRFARKLNGKSYILNAPHMVKSKQLKDLLLLEPTIARHFEMFGELDMALVSIGAPRLHLSGQISSGSLTKADSIQLLELGATANICGKYFDINGNTCNAGINERAIAIELSDLKRIPCVIGVAAGVEKVKACTSILRSRFINVLVIDEILATNLSQII